MIHGIKRYGIFMTLESSSNINYHMHNRHYQNNDIFLHKIQLI